MTRLSLLSGIAAFVLAGSTAFAASAAPIPRPDHLVVVVMENHGYSDVIGNESAPYINSLAARGAGFTRSYGLTHPSQPNYIALFSGSSQGVSNSSCPHTLSAENLGHQLAVHGLGFAGFSEGLPARGSTVCTSRGYVRRHAPWVNFTNVRRSANRTFAEFPSDFSRLPTVSFVIPNLCNSMHDCPVAIGDTWLRRNLRHYVRWTFAHDSLFLLTFDEDDNNEGNRITTIFVGARVRPGVYHRRIDHYSVLRTIEDMYGLSYAGRAAIARPITNVWRILGAGRAAESEFSLPSSPW